jgi:hypothetical protein
MQDDDQPITIVNRAKSQYTYADYELAQEEYRRKTLAREQARSADAQADTTQPAKPRGADDVAQIKQLLAHPDITAEDRAMLERALDEATMKQAFAQPR